MVLTRQQTRAVSKAQEEHGPIDQLSDEVILNIFELLNGTSRPSILAATRVCHRWHALAQQAIEFSVGPLIIGEASQKQNSQLFDRLQRSPGFRARLRHISIKEWYLTELDLHYPNKRPVLPDRDGPFKPGNYFSDTWSEAARHQDRTWRQLKALCGLIPKLSLLSFTWSCTPILPETLAEALASQSQCKVSILRSEAWLDYTQFCYTPYLNRTGFLSLRRIANALVALRVTIPAADSELTSQLGRLVWSAKSLQALEIYALGHIWTDAFVPEALASTKFASYQRVTNLEWLRKPETISNALSIRISTLELSNVCVCNDHSAVEVLSSLDLQRLSNLTLSCVTLLELICAKIDRLSALKFALTTSNDFEYCTCVGSNLSARVEVILKGTSTLRHLHLVNGSSIITSDLLRSSGTLLRSLHVHDYSQWGSLAKCSDVLGEEVIRSMGQYCPALSQLMVDVPYSDKEYDEYLHLISSNLPDLHTLGVYRQIEFPGTDVGDHPRSGVTISSVSADLTHLRPLMACLQRFEVFVTCLPSFDTSQIWHRQGKGIKWQDRTLVAQASPFYLAGESVAPQVHSIDVEAAQEVLAHGGGGLDDSHWKGVLQTVKQVAERAFDFSLQVQIS